MEKVYKTLIIDDEPSLLLGLSSIMKRNGYEVFVASNGAEGLDLAQKELPDIIVSDVMMPPPNGFELRHLLSQNPETANIPFIFLTARVEQDDKLVGIKLGADDYITKPFNREELLARVEAVLRRVCIEQQKGRSAVEEEAREQMERFKHEILQNFHHELRTPLVNILIPLEAAVSNKFTDPADQIKFTEIALSNATKLQSLIEDFILLTHIDNGQLNTYRQEISLEFDFTKPIEKCQQTYQHKNLDVIINQAVTEPISAPRNEFKRVVHHLVDNAFKFSPEGGKVYIRLQSNGDGGCILTVQDQGPGIPQFERKKVFDRYYQISQGDTRLYEGLGVGLHISQAIAQSMGGEIQILDSQLGCKVRFTLPPGEADF